MIVWDAFTLNKVSRGLCGAFVHIMIDHKQSNIRFRLF